MRILVLGGTGAIGKILLSDLCKSGHEIYVTSRQEHRSENKSLHYLKGNAHNIEFLNTVLQVHYDAIVDFMVYEVDEFKRVINSLLYNTAHYFFMSSCRVYADSGSAITEESPRLLDICPDQEFLKTDEYSLIKAREENILIQSEYKNYTIIRPYITYNDNRLQLGVFEKEWWLYRAINGKKILFSNEIADCFTSLTYAYDVAAVITRLIEIKAGKGEIIQIVTGQSIKWKKVLDIYLNILERELGRRPNVVMIDSMEKVLPGITYYNKYQIIYDRAINRVFDSSKADQICGYQVEYTDIKIGLEKCLTDFLHNGRKFNSIQWKMEAYLDIVCGDRTKLKNISKGYRLKYFIWRYTPYLKWIEKGVNQL